MADPAYGAEHRARKAEMLPDAYGRRCPRCGLPILRGQKVDAGHETDVVFDPTSKADRIEHTSCNRSAGAKLKQQISKFAPSRKWY